MNYPAHIDPGAPRLDTLEDMAFNVVYKLLSKATPGTVKFLREYMENQGEMIRDKCIKKFNNLMSRTARYNITDACAFLDSILDECLVDNLEINMPYAALESYPQLFSIIAHRCPKLKSLSITFYSFTKLPSNYISSRLDDFNLSQVDHRLNCLEMLDLHNGPDCSYPYCNFIAPLVAKGSILSIVAEYCPALTSLTVSNFYLRKNDMMALITGASASILFPTHDDRWTNDSVIESLRVPTELMTPLCFTLRRLHLIRRGYFYLCDPHISSPAAAFALKHLPELRTATENSLPTIHAITTLYSNRCGDDGNKTDIQKAFEEYCRDLNVVRRKHPPRPPLSSFLRLTEVREYQQDADMLRAVGYMCPHLERFVFYEEVLRSKVAPEELESILSTWPKLDRISLENFQSFSSRTMKILLGSFSSSLTCVSLNKCGEINMTHLSVCSRLQQLHISKSIIFYSDTCFDADTFLPSLTNFQSDVCLGDFAHLFERKSTLIDAEFNCCHIGTNTCSDPAVEWSKVPKLWPHLQSLRVGQATGLTMDTVSNFVSEMPEISLIELPKSIKLEQTADHIRKIIQDGCKRKQRLLIRHFQKSMNPCPYQRT